MPNTLLFQLLFTAVSPLADLIFVGSVFGVGLTWLALFESQRPQRRHLMTRCERVFLASLPTLLAVFRGYAKGTKASGRLPSWSQPNA